ncbi:ZIP family metal transporter [Mycoplasma seminis]|uniref:ZIP family metal transporter n=1 Tax=Mycoplasma seminis TaxID=512749 RepID=A0ABY9H9P8_9MOLU|nr:ZIP family metal transporter [Mycoplasma seminis]WLP85314.1 ZIP family metal transporter [Mycoplasma seminis]
MSLQDLYIKLSTDVGSEGLATFIVVLVTLLCLLVIPTLLSLILPLFHKLKDKKFRNFTFYLYAFSTGFFLILATFGFLRESIEVSSHGVHDHVPGAADNNNIVFGYNIATIVSGLLIGILFSFTLKFVITYRINKVLKKDKNLNVFVHEHGEDHDHAHGHEHHHHAPREWSLLEAEKTIVNKPAVLFYDGSSKHLKTYSLKEKTAKKYSGAVIYDSNSYVHKHDHGTYSHVHTHPDYIFNQEENLAQAEETIIHKSEPKMKLIALMLLLTHRIPEGILLGYNLSLATTGKTNNLTTAYFLSLILHLIPEESIFYFRLREAGFSKIKSLLLSFLGLSLFLPFMLIGAYVGRSIDQLWWLKAMTFAAIAGIFLFTSIVEFIPEFYHNHMPKKKWFKVLLSLFIGIIVAVAILSFHAH